MSAAFYALTTVLLLPVAATLLPLSGRSHWIFRVFDFPRPQIAALNFLAGTVAVYLLPSPAAPTVALSNLLCLLYQIKEIAAYTRLGKKEVQRYRGSTDERTVSLITANVLTPNRRADLLLNLVRRHAPDMVLTLESDLWWESRLSPLEQSGGYTYTVKVPLDNLYGMHLYSRLPLRDVEIRHWVSEDIPSIRAQVCLKSGEWISIYCLHPMPPSPTEADTSTDRDAELLLVAKEIACGKPSVLVFGDLNDVAWSHTSRLFQQISGLLDPRKGRGLYSTFHAGWPLLRWPLDHIYHSSDFMMSDIRVLPSIGSDHFPVYGRFQFMPAAEAVQQKAAADTEAKLQAAEKIAEADPLKQVVAEKYTETD